MNRFEVLMAPTMCNSVQLAQLAAVPSADIKPEIKNSCRTDLLNPKIRLRDELTTVRMEDSHEGGENGYVAFCRAISKSNTVAIPLEYAGEWYKGVFPDGKFKEAIFRNGAMKFIEMFSGGDPWIIQGAAAVALRSALADEEEAEKAPTTAWKNALSLYEAFFKREKVEGSYAFQFCKEEKQIQDCRDAWTGFLREIVDGLAERVKTYIAQGNAVGVENVLTVLGQPFIKRISPGIYEKTIAECRLPYKQAIQQAHILSEAADLYERCPKAIRGKESEREFVSAMLSAMTMECRRLKSGLGDVELIGTWAEKLSVREIGDSMGPLVSADAQEFFDACAVQIREVINSGKQNDQTGRRVMKRLGNLLPEDFVVAKQPDESDLTKADLARNWVLEDVTKAFEEMEFRSPQSAKNLGNLVWTLISNNIREDREKTSIILYSFKLLTEKIQDGDCYGEYLSAFPEHLPLEGIDGVATLGQFAARFKHVDGDPPHVRQLKEKILRPIASGDADSPHEAAKMGKNVWEIISSASPIESVQSALVTFALNALMQRTSEKASHGMFLTAIPKNLPIKGLDNIPTFGALVQSIMIGIAQSNIENIVREGDIETQSQVRKLGYSVWKAVSRTASEKDEQAALAAAAFNVLVQRTSDKEIFIDFFYYFPGKLPVLGVRGADTVEELVALLHKNKSPYDLGWEFGDAGFLRKLVFTLLLWLFSAGPCLALLHYGVLESIGPLIYLCAPVPALIFVCMLVKGSSINEYKKINMLFCFDHLTAVFLVLGSAFAVNFVLFWHFVPQWLAMGYLRG